MHPLISKTGILLTNLGTPDAPSTEAVSRYLAEFLADPYVVNIPKFIWKPILHGLILKLRSPKSAALYQKIWTEQGSPLLVYSAALIHKLQDKLRPYPIALSLGMRYGQPSLAEALKVLKAKAIDRLVVLPLYPQYSTTTTASTFNTIRSELELLHWQPEIQFVPHYVAESSYIQAIASSIEQSWQVVHPPGQLLLFSFHGLPQKLIKKGDPYLAQCQATAVGVAKKLALPPEKWRIVFQSRFGRARWLQPYCRQVLQALPKQGITTLDVICPGFAVDCLETLEEMAITNKRIFYEAGGINFNYIPALNDQPGHVELLATMLLKYFS